MTNTFKASSNVAGVDFPVVLLIGLEIASAARTLILGLKSSAALALSCFAWPRNPGLPFFVYRRSHYPTPVAPLSALKSQIARVLRSIAMGMRRSPEIFPRPEKTF